MFDGNLRRAQHMASRMKADLDAVEMDGFAKIDRLLRPAKSTP